MENNNQRSASGDSSSSGLSSQDDDHDLIPTGSNAATDTRSYLPSNTSLEILQAHLDADDSDSSDASGPGVHPDFFVHLENLRRVNEANRVNARRDAEAWYADAMGLNQPQHQAPLAFNGSQHDASQMHDQSQHEAPLMFNGSQHQAFQTYNQPQNGASSPVLNQSQNGSFQFANEANQPSYHAGAGNGLQPSAMGMRERYETQDSTAAGPSEPSLHVRFATPTHIGPSHPRDNPHQRRPPSPYPVGFRRAYASGPNYMSNPPLPPTPFPARPLPALPLTAPPMTAPLRPDYTEHGNPYRLVSEPYLLPEDAITHGEERIVQSWLIRQQLIAGVPPQDIQPMAQARDRQHRTPPYIMLNDSGAHIIRVDPARFEGAMLPLSGLPWLPQHANHNAPSSDAPDASGLPTGQNIVTSPSSASNPNSPVDPNLSTAANLLVGPTLSNASNSLAAVAAANSPVASHLPAPATPPAVPTLPANSSSADTPNSPVTPDFPAGQNVLATTTMLATLTLRPDLTVSDPNSIPEQSSGDANEHTAESVNPDPRMVAFFQPLRLHEPTHSVLAPADTRVDAPGIYQLASNENRRTSVATRQSQSQGSTPLTVQNYTDADSIGSPGAPGMVVSPARSQGQGSSTGTDTDNMPSPEAAQLANRLELENRDEPPTRRAYRFAIDGADEPEAKASGDQSSGGGLI